MKIILQLVFCFLTSQAEKNHLFQPSGQPKPGFCSLSFILVGLKTAVSHGLCKPGPNFSFYKQREGLGNPDFSVWY